MAQWAVHAMPDEALALDIQSDMIGVTDTRIVMPLVPAEALPTVDRRLLPVVLVGDVQLHGLTPGISAVPRAALGPVVASAEHARDDVTRALDMVLGGV